MIFYCILFIILSTVQLFTFIYSIFYKKGKTGNMIERVLHKLFSSGMQYENEKRDSMCMYVINR